MKNIVFILTLILLPGCSTIDLDQYSSNQPKLDLFDYFKGTSKGWGIVQDRKGNLTRQFTVDIAGKINANGHLVLTEDFVWSDGEISQRIWTISRQKGEHYLGTADDVSKTATGQTSGNILNWTYSMIIKVDGKEWEVDLDDWMFLQPDSILINKATISKFGIHLGDITIVFAKNKRST